MKEPFVCLSKGLGENQYAIHFLAENGNFTGLLHRGKDKRAGGVMEKNSIVELHKLLGEWLELNK